MQTMPSKKQQIARIIETREPVVEEVEKQQNSLRKTALAIRSLETLQAHIMASGETALIERVRDVSFANIQHEVQVQLAILEKLKVRLSRKTLNIGVIGRARQGKSRLLQSLSGLSANEIPDGDNETCTGVRSTILHHPDASSAEVVFYTEQEFLQDVLTPYYHKIGLGPTPMSVEQFATKPLPAFPQQYKGDASLVAMYNHLVTYRTHIHEYRPLLTTPSPQSIPLSDVRQYVAQDTLDGQRIYYNYLAVREVKVYCQFPFAEDVGQVALVDMPGLGDTGIGDEERLVKALGEDIDVTLFVRMPRQFGDHWTTADTELYKTAHSALKDLLPLDRWAFMILNNTKGGSHKGDNTKNCEALLASLASKFTVSPGSPAFVDHTIVVSSQNFGERKSDHL